MALPRQRGRLRVRGGEIVLRTHAAVVLGRPAVQPRQQGFRQAQLHRARVVLLAGGAHQPAVVAARALVRGVRGLARHVGAPGLVPAAAPALDRHWVLLVVQSDDACQRLLARLLVPTPLPVLTERWQAPSQ